MPVAPRITLSSDRRRAAKSVKKLLVSIGASDAKLYARDKPFLPIFPTDNAPLTAALTLIMARLTLAIDPPR